MRRLRDCSREGTSRVRLAFACAIVLILMLSALLGTPADGQQGESLPGLRGGQLSSAELAQGTQIIVVWASWSPRCRDISPRVNDLVQKFSGQGRVVTVNFQEEAPAIEDFVRQQPLNAPIFLDRDGAFSKRHAVTTLPGLIVMRNGEVLFEGRLAGEAEAQIRDLLR